MTFYVTREDGVKIEGLTKEQIYELINGTTGEVPEGVDEAFITKLKEVNKGENSSVWIGTNAEYNAIQTKDDNTLYVITDDTYYEDVQNSLNELDDRMGTVEQGFVDYKGTMNNEFSVFEEGIQDQLDEIWEHLNAPVKFITIQRPAGYDYTGTQTVTISEDFEIGKPTTVYFLVQIGGYGSEELSIRSGCNVNAKTSGNYSILECTRVAEARGYSGNTGSNATSSISVSSGGESTSQRLFTVNNINDTVGGDSGSGGQYAVGLPCLLVKVRLIRNS